jgi:WD40 repeat protein
VDGILLAEVILEVLEYGQERESTSTAKLTNSGTNPDSTLVEVLHSAAHSRSCFTLSWTSGGTSSETGGLGLLASGGADGKIIIWQITSPVDEGDAEVKGKKTRVVMTPIAATRDSHGVADVNCLTWLQREDGAGHGVLASCADDGSIKAWRVVGDAV